MRLGSVSNCGRWDNGCAVVASRWLPDVLCRTMEKVGFLRDDREKRRARESYL